MTDALWLALALVAGGALGAFYFGALWLTVRRMPTARRPALLAIGSFAGRTAVVVAGFYLVMGGDWRRAAVCLAGFLIVRTILVRRLRPLTEEQA